jgi:NitT/TauT family transport system permease protein
MLVVLAALVLLGDASRRLLQPLGTLNAAPASLAPIQLPEYAVRTTLRMLAAMIASLAFTLSYATWAAKSRRAGLVLIPLLDILQSVPVLGFIFVNRRVLHVARARRAVIDWGRYAEMFAYDFQKATFSLENPT